MGRRAFNVKNVDDIEPCPKCGNRERFVGMAQQVAEDLCEVWIVCVCGYDPTEGRSGDRMEDVWGSLDGATLACALSNCWDEPLRERSAPTVRAEHE
jgi:hypothetical protein